MVRMCRAKDWAKLNSTLAIINKRRAQSKEVVVAIVNEGLSYVEESPSQAEKVELIKTLMEICDTKIYVEAESARLHLMLALMYETEGKLDDACNIIQDVHVETYGSLTRVEKADYILHQIRLNLLNRDYVRAMIQSRKMNRWVTQRSTVPFCITLCYSVLCCSGVHNRVEHRIVGVWSPHCVWLCETNSMILQYDFNW
jgi:26S proteasome regulatory subunit N5